MNIDRHNYEEFFILYLDNELSATDRQRVEEFAAANPDLKAELGLLLQSKLIPDTDIIFDGKDALLKEEVLSAETSSMLLYIDEEFTPAQKKSFEQWLAENPAAQKELNLLQQTKLQPEQIVFPYKDSLYRQEERRVVPIRWWRMAAAAVLLLGISTAAFMFNHKRQGNIAGNTSSTEQNSLAEVKAKHPTSLSDSNTAELNPSAITDQSGNTDAAATEDQQQSSAQQRGEVIHNTPSAIVVSPVNTDHTNGFTGSSSIIDNSNHSQHTVEEKSYVVNKRTELSELINDPSANIDLSEADPSLTIHKQINPLPAVTQEEDQPLDIMNEPGKKNRLRGFFRKITRTFEKTTNIKATDGEDRLLVGGLAIKF